MVLVRQVSLTRPTMHACVHRSAKHLPKPAEHVWICGFHWERERDSCCAWVLPAAGWVTYARPGQSQGICLRRQRILGWGTAIWAGELGRDAGDDEGRTVVRAAAARVPPALTHALCCGAWLPQLLQRQ